ARNAERGEGAGEESAARTNATRPTNQDALVLRIYFQRVNTTLERACIRSSVDKVWKKVAEKVWSFSCHVVDPQKPVWGPQTLLQTRARGTRAPGPSIARLCRNM
ncbi:unnamed protein product, partial [Ectocarpus sp. 13 AM-2016]